MKQAISPQIFDLLLALAQGPQHGYALMQRVEAQHGGAYRPSPGVVYANLQRMLDWEWIVEAAPPSGSTDPRRKHYCLTPSGGAAAQAHASAQATHYAQASQALRGIATC